MLKKHKQARRASVSTGDEFLSRRSLSDAKSLIGGVTFALMGLMLLFWGLQAGWNGVSWGSTRSGQPVATPGKFLILGGLACLGGGGGMFFVGVRRFQFR